MAVIASASGQLQIETESRSSLCLSGVVLDVPDVLYDATHWRRWLFQLLTRINVVSNYADFHWRWERQLVDVHRGRREYTEALQSFLIDLGLSWAQVDEVEAASRIQRQALENDVRPLPGVAATLYELSRRGLPLVAWADVPLSGARFAERLARLVPRASFHAVLTSFDTEQVQPDSECYLAMIESLGTAPESVLYVGHDEDHARAASSAGLQASVIRYQAGPGNGLFLSRFEELLGIVDTWGRGALHAPGFNSRSEAEPVHQNGA